MTMIWTIWPMRMNSPMTSTVAMPPGMVGENSNALVMDVLKSLSAEASITAVEKESAAVSSTETMVGPAPATMISRMMDLMVFLPSSARICHIMRPMPIRTLATAAACIYHHRFDWTMATAPPTPVGPDDRATDTIPAEAEMTTTAPRIMPICPASLAAPPCLAWMANRTPAIIKVMIAMAKHTHFIQPRICNTPALAPTVTGSEPSPVMSGVGTFIHSEENSLTVLPIASDRSEAKMSKTAPTSLPNPLATRLTGFMPDMTSPILSSQSIRFPAKACSSRSWKASPMRWVPYLPTAVSSLRCPKQGCIRSTG